MPSFASDSDKRLYIVGHAYGGHGGTNPGLFDPLLEFLDREPSRLEHPWVFAGDFIRHCTDRNWSILLRELAQFSQPVTLVRGSHERRDRCTKLLVEHAGDLDQTIDLGGLVVVTLDSENPDRVLNKRQIDRVVGASRESGSKPLVVVTHYLLWASRWSRYQAVPGNQGSRSARVARSNYWEDLHPVLRAHRGKAYIVGGDTGGRPDSVSPVMDVVDGVSLIATGIGEVPGAHVLELRVTPADVVPTIVPLAEGESDYPLHIHEVFRE